MASKKVMFLDRDGTIIEDKIYLNDPDQIIYLPRAIEAMVEMQGLGFEFVIVTNQSGVPRGLVQLENLHEIHRRMEADLHQAGIQVLSFHYAPHLPSTDHPLRKPNPGMLMEATEKFDIDLAASWMAGDRMTDVEAGHRAGTKSILLGNLEPPEESEFEAPEIHAPTLWEATQILKTSWL